MKYLNKLFASSSDSQQEKTDSSISLKPSATLASTLYSVTFIAKSQPNFRSKSFNRQQLVGDNGEDEDEHNDSDSDSDGTDAEEQEARQGDHRLRQHSNTTQIIELDDCNPSVTIEKIDPTTTDCFEIEKKPLNNKRKTKRKVPTLFVEEDKQQKLSGQLASDKNIDTLDTSKNCGIVGSLGNYILTATIGKTIANTSSVITSQVDVDLSKEEKKKLTNFTNQNQQQTLLVEDEDWILVDNNSLLTTTSCTSSSNNRAQLDNTTKSNNNNNNINRSASFAQAPKTYRPSVGNNQNIDHNHSESSSGVTQQQQNSNNINTNNNNNNNNRRIIKLYRESIIRQMALDNTDVELIKASWIPARKDPVFSGVLLFKGLFTKFPEYLKFFPQFSDLDIENMRENKRLLRHAVKVIETVTFVVDAIGNDSMTAQLNQALQNLVSSHLKRNIGLNEFRNLGIVLIDFICELNNRRQQQKREVNEQCQLNKSSTGDSINHSSNDDSETMTSTLDKVRASSSPSSSSEDDSYLVGGSASRGINNVSTNDSINVGFNKQQQQDADLEANNDVDSGSTTKIDTNVLVAAWTKLYSSILDLVEHEEAQ